MYVYDDIKENKKNTLIGLEYNKWKTFFLKMEF